MNASFQVIRDEDCKVVAYALAGSSKVNLDTLDLWVKLQAYHHFMTKEQAIEAEQQRKGYNGRFGLKAKAYHEGIKVLTKIGLIEDNTPNGHRVLPASEFVAKKAKKYTEAKMAL